MSDNLVPYHYCEWPSGRYILKEMNSEQAAKASVDLADYLGEPVSNRILWGKPGDSEAGFHRPAPRCSRDRNSRLFLLLVFFGTFLFWIAILWLYFHGSPLWLR